MTDSEELTLYQRLRILEAGARRAMEMFAEAVPPALPIDNPPPAWCAVVALKSALRDAGLEDPARELPGHREDDELTPPLPFEETA